MAGTLGRQAGGFFRGQMRSCAPQVDASPAAGRKPMKIRPGILAADTAMSLLQNGAQPAYRRMAWARRRRCRLRFFLRRPSASVAGVQTPHSERATRMLGCSAIRDRTAGRGPRAGCDPVGLRGDAGSRVTGRGGWPAAVAVCVALLALAACDGSSSSSAPGATGGSSPITRTSSVPAGGNPSPAVPDAVAVEAAYRAFWPVLATFARQPEARWRGILGQVAVDPQLGLTIALSREQRRNGVTVYGQPRPRVPAVRVGAGGTALVQDCADFSATGQADARTGQRKTVGIPRNPVRVSLREGADGRWRVSEVQYPGGRC